MNVRKYALFGGIFFLAMGIAAFIPGLFQYADETTNLPALNLNTSYGLFLGFLPMNIVNKLLLIVLGCWGIAASQAPGTSLPRSIVWSRWVFGISGVLAVLGLLPNTNTMFGYWPLFSWNVATSGVISLVAAYFGYRLTAKVPHDSDAPVRRTVGDTPARQH